MSATEQRPIRANLSPSPSLLVPHALKSDGSADVDYLPYSEYFGLISFSASIGIGVALGATLSTSLDDESSTQRLAFGWSTAAFAGVLLIGLTVQLLLTHPKVRFEISQTQPRRGVYKTMAGLAFIGSVLFLVGICAIGVGLMQVPSCKAAGLSLVSVVGLVTVVGILIWLRWEGLPSIQSNWKADSSEPCRCCKCPPPTLASLTPSPPTASPPTPTPNPSTSRAVSTE